MLLRGPGDFFSTFANDNIRQSGGFTFRLATYFEDTVLFDVAFSLAKAIVNDDPSLTKDENKQLSEQVKNLICTPSTIS